MEEDADYLSDITDEENNVSESNADFTTHFVNYMYLISVFYIIIIPVVYLLYSLL